MYSHITKGWTTGHTLSRLLFRNITSLPGVAIDFIVAIFWVPDYWSYWEDAAISYSDGKRVGVAAGIFGWIGEILGYAIRGPLGATIGFVLFFPNSILQFAAWVQRTTYDALNNLVGFANESSFFEQFVLFSKPENYMCKAWNIGAVILGTVIAAIPYVAAQVKRHIQLHFSKKLPKLGIQPLSKDYRLHSE